MIFVLRDPGFRWVEILFSSSSSLSSCSTAGPSIGSATQSFPRGVVIELNPHKMFVFQKCVCVHLGDFPMVIFFVKGSESIWAEKKNNEWVLFDF